MNYRLAILLFALCLTGCGTNKFQREVVIEDASIGLTRETLQGGYELVSTSELKKMLDNGEDILLVDAMPAQDSYNKGHLAGAVNFVFPKKVIDGWDDGVMEGQTQADYEQLLGEDKDRKIVFYCGYVKCARSHNAAICARDLGYTNLYRYPGGIYAWRGAGHALTTD